MAKALRIVQMRKSRFFLWCVLLCYTSLSLIAQHHSSVALPSLPIDSLGTRYGAVLNLNYNIHSATFRQLPGVPFCCPSFGGGSGAGYTVGLLYAFPLSLHTLLTLRTTLSTHDALLSSEHFSEVYANGTRTTGKAIHELDTRLNSLGIEPLAGYHLGEGLFVHGGLRIAALQKAYYIQEDHVILPQQGGTFLNPAGLDSYSDVRYQASGELERLRFQFGLVAGTSYEIPISRNGAWILSPEIFFYYALTPLMSGISWHTHSLRAGVSLIYTPKPAVVTRHDTVYRHDTVFQRVAAWQEAQLRWLKRTESSRTEQVSQYLDVCTTTFTDHYQQDIPQQIQNIAASLSVQGTDSTGNEAPLATLRIEEFCSDMYHPLLPYIFFDSASAHIPARYSQFSDNAATSSFREDALHGDSTLAIYHHILNIIGARLHTYPEASITLVGCNDGREESDTTLSVARAAAVKDYLVHTWNIAEHRIILQARGLPAKASNSASTDGDEENRRVEIYGSLPALTDVVITRDTIRRSNPPRLRFVPKVTTTETLRHWMIFIEDENAVMKEFSGKGTPPPLLEWDVEAENFPANAHRPTAGKSELKATLFLRSEGGNSLRVHQNFTLEYHTIRHKQEERLGDTLIERYGIILFDYGSPLIDERNSHTIAFLRSRLQPDSRVFIEGYTDRTGDDESNLRLSEERANETARIINRPSALQQGYGQRRLLYDNTTPEGRQYCRTVRIRVETPRR